MNKLVRDRIPEIITNKGQRSIGYHADAIEFRKRLADKLLEEAKEFQEAESMEELADVLEVIDALYQAFDFQPEEVQKVQESKRQERGAFNLRYILQGVESGSTTI